ncbi:hypothetical protein [Halopiger goleimassiliensis]|uniref:hypothetical protein n=1 Tax=Halopiger goleimassiliensis TaxID=1293048 RepID=UPI00067821B0|nr:hypothetical protein [Halopiger goleimassiliensis]
MPRPSGPPRDADELLICADVLGAFGVGPTDVARADADTLEEALATALADGQHRTSVLRRTIARSDPGLGCAARYAHDALVDELETLFESVDWSFEMVPATERRDRWTVRVSDHRGRQAETTVAYPDTPLGTDNLPAILHALNTSLLAGTDARFVLLSSGRDRWQAALVDPEELERLRDRYGPRITAVERPLLPEHPIEAYVPDADSADGRPSSAEETDPWPDWAQTRERDDGAAARADGADASQSTLTDVASLIEDPETDDHAEADAAGSSAEADESDDATDDRGAADDAAAGPGTAGETTEGRSPVEPAAASSTAATDGFELRGSPSVSRVSDDAPTETTSPPECRRADRSLLAADSDSSDADANSRADDAFGTLSGTTRTARVSNDSFGSDVAWDTETDRYRALGAALGAGGRVSVRGLLEDDEFLPELPAAEPERTRIEFEDPFDPGALHEARAAAEQSGFVWVDAGTLDRTRVSNG